MPSSAVHTFTDPAEYAAAIQQGTYELTVTEPGDFIAKLIRIDLHRLSMQRFSDNLPLISHITGWSGRAVFAFRTRSGPSLLSSGAEMLPTNIVRYSEGQSYFRRSAGFALYGSISMPVAEIVSVGAAMAGLDLTPPEHPLVLTPPPSAMTRLQRLHSAAGQLAEDVPEVIAHPEAARGLEQRVIEALVGSLHQGAAGEDRAAQRNHSLVMRRFRRALEEDPSQPLYIAELCKMIGVTDRTLEVCCQEQLGMGPKRFLLLRRLHLARRTLRETAPDATTVSGVATQYGFWHFGRFAGEYRCLFGESPSATLHRQSE